jgi:DnaJ-class molecular chaperone
MMVSTEADFGGGASTSKKLDLAESVAGEEDPGASMDAPEASASSGQSDRPGRSDQPAGRGGDRPSGAQAPMAPGDEAPPGTPGTGEDICPRCGGSGKLAGRDCPECQGTGKVTVGIGGA